MLFVDFLLEAVHLGVLGIGVLPELSGDGEGIHLSRLSIYVVRRQGRLSRQITWRMEKEH